MLAPTFGGSVSPTSPNYDLVPAGFINVLDAGKVLPPYFGHVCE